MSIEKKRFLGIDITPRRWLYEIIRNMEETNTRIVKTNGRLEHELATAKADNSRLMDDRNRLQREVSELRAHERKRDKMGRYMPKRKQ